MPILTEHQARDHIKKMVRRLKTEIGFETVPGYEEARNPVSAHLGVQVHEHALPLGNDGQYVPAHSASGNTPLICLSTLLEDSERRNFTFYHEIAHHLIQSDSELLSFLHEFAFTSEEAFDKTLEDFCNFWAAEFLIPSDDVRQAISNRGFSVELIRQFDLMFPASKPAIAIQLAQCTTHKCIVLVCAYQLTSRAQGQQLLQTDLGDQASIPRLHVQYSSSSPSNKYRTGRFVQVPIDHIITDAFKRRQLIKGRDRVPTRSGRHWLAECEAMHYKGKVYAVFNLEAPPDPHNSEQLAFGF